VKQGGTAGKCNFRLSLSNQGQAFYMQAPHQQQKFG